MVHLISKPRSDTNYFVYYTSNDKAPQYMDILAAMIQYLVSFGPTRQVTICVMPVGCLGWC